VDRERGDYHFRSGFIEGERLDDRVIAGVSLAILATIGFLESRHSGTHQNTVWLVMVALGAAGSMAFALLLPHED
jgi:hypothetical protein